MVEVEVLAAEVQNERLCAVGLECSRKLGERQQRASLDSTTVDVFIPALEQRRVGETCTEFLEMPLQFDELQIHRVQRGTVALNLVGRNTKGLEEGLSTLQHLPAVPLLGTGSGSSSSASLIS